MASLGVKIMLSFIAVLFLGCSNNPIDVVKNGTLDIDKSVSIGNAFEGYKYFSDKRWKTFVDQQKRTIVEFSADLRLDMQDIERNFGKFGSADPNRLEQIKSIVYIAQFKINKDELKKFNIAYSAIMITLKNGRKGENIDRSGDILREIYNNKQLTGWILFLLNTTI